MKKMKATMVLFCALAAGCAIGPDYKRPVLNVPDSYRGAYATQGASLGNEPWWKVFRDKNLQDLIHEALAQNYDLRIAADQIVQAQEQLNIINSYQLPTVTLDPGIKGQRIEKIRTVNAYTIGTYQLIGMLSWDIDFWGKYRRMIEASRANVLATQWARQEVVLTLIADVASAYFNLRELDMELDIAKKTLAARKDQLALTQQLADHGAVSLLDVRQAEELVFTAGENIPDVERRIQQQENLLSILLARNPGPMARGWSLDKQPLIPAVSAGIPSSLLERRPDIRQAEAQLIAANAQIGVAQGAYFPDISLTGDGGFQSAALSKLFTGPSGLWDIAGNLTQPIFTAGRIKAGIKYAQAQKTQALHIYQKTIQEAFREVSDALIGYSKTEEFRRQQELLTQAAGDALRLSRLRYEGGRASFLEVLEGNTRYYAAQLQLAQAKLNELQALVILYKVLGAGWQAE